MSNITYEKGRMTITVAGVDDVARALGDLRAKTPSTVKVAINATAREARKLMIQKAQARYAVNAAGARHLKDLKPRKKATNTSLSAELYISKMRNDLGYFQNSPKKVFTGASVMHHAPNTVRARVLKSERMKPLTGNGEMSKGFLLEFSNGHVGMVQRHTGTKIDHNSDHSVTRRGYLRWRNSQGIVEKLVTMGSPSATAMHNTVWPYIEPEVEDYLEARLQAQVDRVLARAAAKSKR